MKKTLVLVAVVIGIHCVAISALLLIQGCKTTKGKNAPAETAAPMPPLTAPAPEAMPAPIEPTPAFKETKEEGTSEYIVKKGDSLGLIAKNHNVSKTELMELNKLADPNKIRVGQKLIIPKRSHVAASPAKIHEAKSEAKPVAKKGEKSEPTPSLAAGINEYVVQTGDSLSKISAKLNVKISELREVNKLANDKLKIGQKLIVPGAKKVEAAPEAAPAPAAPEKAPAKAEAAPAATTPPPAVAPAAPAPVPTAATPAKATGSGITHVVSPNEDLSSIAKLYAVTVEDIVAANQLGTNRTVQAGQKITIP
jgi:LysM repeat protein